LKTQIIVFKNVLFGGLLSMETIIFDTFWCGKTSFQTNSINLFSEHI